MGPLFEDANYGNRTLLLEGVGEQDLKCFLELFCKDREIPLAPILASAFFERIEMWPLANSD